MMIGWFTGVGHLAITRCPTIHSHSRDLIILLSKCKIRKASISSLAIFWRIFSMQNSIFELMNPANQQRLRT